MVLEQQEIALDPRFNLNHKRIHNLKELEKIINDKLLTLTADEIMGRLEAAKIANARMNTMHEFIEHPQLKARNRWREVETEVGPVRALIPPAMPEGIEPVMKPVPRLGEHNELILAEIGRSKSVINKG
ncbi:CoA transferase [Aneurinibacillus tyrosinisolvens]|uniref:CoA transferase n=1 Tax=Aneurinibacillus tyrosinisolvens TaxID=1443435 RepID=UPI0034E210E4